MELSTELQTLIEGLRQEIADLRAENAALKQEVADLRRQLGKDSGNSSKPPSSDPPWKKARVAGSLRGKSGKTSGGQEGHKGGTLRQTNAPDRKVRHKVCACAHCHAALSAKNVIGVEKRQVFDMPEPRLEVTEHQGDIAACERCGKITKAAFPENVISPVQYGPRIKAAAIYLNAQHLIPEDRVAEAMKDLFGADLLCPASVATWSAKKAEDLRPFVEHIAKLVAGSPVRHLDETGFRIGGKTWWLHGASTIALTHYRVDEKRGAIPFFTGGVIVHDHFKPYYTLANIEHALCNAHHLRELKALIEIEKEPWAVHMRRLLLKMNAAVHRAKGQGATVLAERLKRRFLSLYDAIVERGFRFHEGLPAFASAPRRGRVAHRPGFNLLRRLRDFRGDVLRFIHDFAVPFTNNQAEQDIRMMKVKMKISGGFRTTSGAETFAALRSVISTARKHGWNILKTLASTPDCLIQPLSA